MKNKSLLVAFSILIASLIIVGIVFSQPSTDSRNRQRIELSAPYRDMVLEEMRIMLESIHGIVNGIANDDTAAIVEAARKSGLVIVADMDPRLNSQLPADFLQLRMLTHEAFDVFAAAVEEGQTADETIQSLAAIMRQCVGCHTAYRLDEIQDSPKEEITPQFGSLQLHINQSYVSGTNSQRPL